MNRFFPNVPKNPIIINRKMPSVPPTHNVILFPEEPISKLKDFLKFLISELNNFIRLLIIYSEQLFYSFENNGKTIRKKNLYDNIIILINELKNYTNKFISKNQNKVYKRNNQDQYLLSNFLHIRNEYLLLNIDKNNNIINNNKNKELVIKLDNLICIMIGKLR